MTAVVIYNSGSTQKPFSVASTVAYEARKTDPNVTVLDVENFTYIHQGLPPAWFAKLWGYQVYPQSFRNFLKQIDVGYHLLPKPSRRASGVPLPPEVAEQRDDAIRSDLFTYLRTDRLEDHPFFAPLTARRMRKLSTPLFGELTRYLQAHSVDTVYVPNGRVAHQRLAILAAQAAGCVVRFYEIGRAIPHSAYIGHCQIHDREATQEEARQLEKTLTVEEITDSADQWLLERTTLGSTINPFSKTWRQFEGTVPDTGEKEEKKRAVFFTSSADEFSSYGAKWASQSWPDQFEAFTAIARVLEPQGVALSLRVHPNLVNKSRKYFRREMAGLKNLKNTFPNLTIVTHTQSTSSYALVAESDYVFVGRSTLGLEASLMGKCVWTTTPARYDDVADVRKLHSPAEVTERNLQLWESAPLGAQTFIAYWASQDYPFVAPDSQWCSWALSSPPFGLPIGNLFLPNALMHTLHLIRLEFVTWIQRRTD